MTRSSFEDLLRHGAEPKFNYIDPPFNYNSPGVSQYPVEVSGRYLLNILCLRLGWPSDMLVDLVERGGWQVKATYARSKFQQAAFVCQ